MNKVILMGRLTKDVEVKSTSTDTKVARFTLAVNRKYAKEGEERQADFVSCVAFNKLAEFTAKYFGKGAMVAVVGEVRTGAYSKEDGTKVYTTDVFVNEVNFTGEKRGKNEETKSSTDGFFPIAEDGEDETLPF